MTTTLILLIPLLLFLVLMLGTAGYLLVRYWNGAFDEDEIKREIAEQTKTQA